jgi:hypothetical protein
MQGAPSITQIPRGQQPRRIVPPSEWGSLDDAGLERAWNDLHAEAIEAHERADLLEYMSHGRNAHNVDRAKREYNELYDKQDALALYIERRHSTGFALRGVTSTAAVEQRRIRREKRLAFFAQARRDAAIRQARLLSPSRRVSRPGWERDVNHRTTPSSFPPRRN